jgi:hypothetical protein
LNAATQVVDLDEWRFGACSSEERRAIVRRRAQSRPRLVAFWEALLGASLSDARDTAAILHRLGGHPIAIHGVRRDGSCTCGRAACGAIGKHPVSARWQDESLDLGRLNTLLQERHDLNLGWRMGLQPDGWRLVTVDVDGPLSLLEPLVRQWGPLPPTLTAETGRGGRHLIYRLRDDAPSIRNRRGVAPNVDIRGEGGQIVISPSRHHSGSRYRWLEAREPAVLP